jgi:hypothetical protein
VQVECLQFLFYIQPQIHDNKQNDYQIPQFEPFKPEATMPEADSFYHDSYDKYIGAQVMLPKNEQYLLGTILGSIKSSSQLGIPRNLQPMSSP